MDAYRIAGKREDSYVYHCGDGYQYHFNNGNSYNEGNSNIIYLRCIQRNKRGCCGTAKVTQTPDGIEWINLKAHHCPPNRLRNQVMELRQEILRECVNPNGPHETPAEVVRRVGLRYPPNVAATVTSDRMRSAINRQRNRMYPQVPVSLHRLGAILHDPQNRHLTVCMDGVDSIYGSHVLGQNGNCSVIFISRRIRRFMNRYRNVIFCDGTFSSRPNSPNSAQVLQIVAVAGRNTCIPLVQVLMSSKTEAEYVTVLQEVQRLVPNFRPSLVVTDFEVGLQNAWRRVFHVHVTGCYWHYCRAVILNAKDLGLGPAMQHNRQLKSIVRSTLAIPLLPTRLMARACQTLIQEANRAGLLHQLTPFFNYYIGTWMSPSRFQSLSVYGIRHRTNNVCESSNRVLRQMTGNTAQRPKLWRFIFALKKYEAETRLRLRRINMGLPLNRKQKTSAVNNDRRIRNLTVNLLTGLLSINRFLHLSSTRVMRVFNRFLDV